MRLLCRRAVRTPCLTCLCARGAEKRGSPLVAYKFSAAVLRMVAGNPVALLASEAGRSAVLAVLRYATLTAETAANVLMTVKYVWRGVRVSLGAADMPSQSALVTVESVLRIC